METSYEMITNTILNIAYTKIIQSSFTDSKSFETGRKYSLGVVFWYLAYFGYLVAEIFYVRSVDPKKSR